MEAIFDYIVTELNDNPNDLKYNGNYVFNFLQDKLTLYNTIEGTIVREEVGFVPVSVLTKQPVPFVDNNKRIDWLLEIGFIMRIEGKEYNPLIDLDFANIKTKMKELQGTIYEEDGIRYTIKTQEPNYNGYAFLGQSKVAVVSIQLNVTQIDFGYFGQESVISIDDTVIDWTRVAYAINKGFYTANKKGTLENDYNKPINRAVTIELTFNYNGETNLLNEARGKADLKQTHTLSEVFAGYATPFEYDLVIESCQEEMIKGGVKQITIRFVEV